ncbi:hypothetical protein DFJ58DRAFT_843132 [Suillus subalutaceus]|uniref:uncharacterized protein n=1 Tax=Suillus subalutaceus TaxID=48586 RepID=UPI001B883A2A|nr:uncharacterized protein DFJ58DRAFT_843132 [Suillus subalutaceus]KAG1847688.1 hypothetical protein DFJ58DRAFT_843132 [Suillus subalutaceus]
MAPEVNKYSLVSKDAISQDIVNISQFAEVELPLRHTSPQADPEQQAGSMRDEDNQPEGSLEERYEGAGMCYSEDGLTFLDVFDADEYAEYRKENLFYPFASKEEQEISDFLLCSPLSMAAIDVFLKLPLIQKLQLSFSNARELRSHVEMLPSGPSWKCQIIPSTHPTKYLIQLFWRDPIEFLESLFSNPLFHDKLDFVPHRVYTMVAHLMRVYSEWTTGDAALEMQTQFPRGATVLGAVLSSDKTNITTMTGARIAHPLLLGLANIHMCTHTKLSSKAFLLTALLPIPKYLHPNQRMRGMLEDHLIHQCLSIVLKPLMKAAEVGIMMSDPVGNVQHCFTPLAVFIVDTPQAAMLACTGLLTDPSIFLMSEPLHHWHKELFDHDCQWCLVIVGASELDFWFSILQPVIGYRHFAGGISKLKQCPAPDDDLLASIDRSLSTFHDNKDIILTSGVRMGAKRPIDNWFIPKLELLQSITSGTRNIGALIQWSADATEHAHILEIKDPAQGTKNNDYDPQICRHLDRDEKLQCFTIATTLQSHHMYRDPNDRSGEVPEEEAEENEAINCNEQEQDNPWTALLEEMNHIYALDASSEACTDCRVKVFLLDDGAGEDMVDVIHSRDHHGEIQH